MSLQVWLPLTKDLRQQGLSNVTVTNNGATFNSAGKLGGCYYFNGSSTLIFPSYDTTRSIAFWIKAPKTNSTIAFVDYKSKLGFGFQSDGYIIPNCADSSLKMYAADNFIANEWNHIVVMRDDNFTDVTLYINGMLQTSRINSNNNWTNNVDNCYIGGRSTGTNMTCYMNDFRVYDHCLSPMEVKELAKGLVLHYPLNRQGWGQENLLKGTDTGSGWSYSTFDVSKGVFTRSTTSTSESYVQFNGYNVPVEAGVTYTLSCYAKSNGFVKSMDMYKYNSSVQNIQYTSYNLTTDYKLYTFTFTPQATENVTIRFDNNGSTTSGTEAIMYIKRPKLEKGSIATPWCPNSSDALATTMGLNSTTEYDCSGFCNNGEKIGALTYTSDTPKYAVSTHIGATSQKIHISNFPTSGFGNSYAFAWWGKNTTFSNKMFWGFSDGIRLNGMYSGVLWNTGDSSNNPLYKINTTTQVSAPSVNTWHHYVMVGNGTKCYVYLDGELWAESKTYKAINGTSIYINGWGNTTDYCYDNMDICDFRIYATALSADDVKSLYQNCATIDPDGTIRGQIRS